MNQLPSSHPLCRQHHISPMESFSSGFTSAGRFTDVYTFNEYDVWYIFWDYELAGGEDVDNCSVFVVVNGDVYDVVSPDNSPYIYRMDVSKRKISMNLYLLPNTNYYRYINYGMWDLIMDRVELTWTQSDDADKAKVYGNTGATPTTLLGTITEIVPVLVDDYSTLTNTKGYTHGNWLHPTIKFAEITITTSEAGQTEGLECTYSCTETGESGTFTLYEIPEEVLRGIYFYADGAELMSGETWTIRVGIKPTFTTQSLSDGSYSFKIQLLDQAGNSADSLALYPVVVNTPPNPPTLDSYSYVDGSGQISFDIRTPNDSTVNQLRIYQNFAWDSTGILHWLPVSVTTVVHNTLYTVGPIGNMSEGKNVFVFRAVDSSGKESPDLRVVVTLDASLNEIDDPPSPPQSIDAVVRPSGYVVITAVVDRSVDTVNFYEVEDGVYTLIGSGSNSDPDNDTEEVKISYVPSRQGLFVYGARSESNSVEEQNTDVLCELWYDTVAPSAATGLSAKVIR